MKKIKEWILNHKIITTTGIVFILIILGVVGVISTQFAPINTLQTGFEESTDYYKNVSRGAVGAESSTDPAEDSEAIIEVKRGSLEVDSKDAKSDEQEARSITEKYNGYIEENYQRESSLWLRINMTTRVPAEDFEAYFGELRDSFEVDSYSLENYRLNIQRSIDKIDVIEDALASYNQIEKELKNMEVSVDKFDLLDELTQRKLDLASKEKKFQREIAQANQKGEFATVNITLEERISPEIMPEDVGAKFKDGLSKAIESIVDSLINVVTVTISLIFTVLEYAVYALVIIIPVWFILGLIFKLLSWTYKKVFK